MKFSAAGGASDARGIRPVHTYSIVARDPKSGELGAAVQSHWFSVGAGVIWAESEVGAVATQAFADPSYGPLGLALMRAGRSAPDALRGLVAADEGRALRQVAMVDAAGRVAAHTGSSTITAAGHQTGDQFSVQANMMLRATVWPAMADAFRAASGDLAERMIAALDAAEGEGGDIRGMQSAALVVAGPRNTGRPWADRIFDLRVDDAERPLDELKRLLRIARGYRHDSNADRALRDGDTAGEDREYARAEELLGANPEMRFWHAISLLVAGRSDEGIAMLAEVGAQNANWIELALRLPPQFRALEAAVKERIRRLLP
jgi:uncharacterized Ntn-hydrolase superfamily protein